MNDQEQPKTVIGTKTACILYAALIGFAVYTLKGTPRAIAIIVVLALAAKSCVDYLRRR